MGPIMSYLSHKSYPSYFFQQLLTMETTPCEHTHR